MGHKRLREGVEDYLGYRKAKYSATTVANESYVLRRFAAWVGDIQLRHLRAERVSGWFYSEGGLLDRHVTRDGVQREPITPATHNFYRSRLASFFRFASWRGWIKDDLLREVDPMRVSKRQRLQPPPHRLLALLGEAENDRDRLYLATAMFTGLRTSEITRMLVGDVDLDAGVIAIVRSKSDEEDVANITVELDGELRTWLRSYAVSLGRPLDPGHFLFPARQGSRYVYRKAQDGALVKTRTKTRWLPDKAMTHAERVVQGVLGALGYPTRGEGTHTLRRASARAFFDSMASDLGYDAALRTTAAFLGHASSGTTEGYLGLSSERKRRDQALRGRPFLSAMIDTEGVIPLGRDQSGRSESA